MRYNNIMNEFVKQSIDARKSAIFNAYEVGSAEKKKVDTLFEKIEELGKNCQEVGEFETEFAKSPFNQEYLDLFTEIATSSPAKGLAASGGSAGVPADVSTDIVAGAATGLAENVATGLKQSVVPTRAAVHQKAYDAARDVPVLGEAINIKEKVGYAAHLGKLFKKRGK